MSFRKVNTYFGVYTDESKVENDITLCRVVSEDRMTYGGWLSERATVSDQVNWISDGCSVFGGDLSGGIFVGGNFYGGSFYDGVFMGGEFHEGIFDGGVFNGGTFKGGLFFGGEFHGGVFTNGVFRAGVFRGGRFDGWEFQGGIFLEGDETTMQPIFQAGLDNGMTTVNVTITDKHMTIHTTRHSLRDWLRFGPADFDDLDAYALAIWKKHRDSILEVCVETGRVSETDAILSRVSWQILTAAQVDMEEE